MTPAEKAEACREKWNNEADERVYQAQLRVVVDRLEKWIGYHRERNRLDVRGFPEATQIARMSGEREAAERKGIKGDGITGKRVYACMIHGTGGERDWSEEMETARAIEAMPGELRKVIKMNYLDAGTQEMKAARLKVSEATYKGRLNMAHCCLMGWGAAHGWYGRVDYQ